MTAIAINLASDLAFSLLLYLDYRFKKEYPESGGFLGLKGSLFVAITFPVLTLLDIVEDPYDYSILNPLRMVLDFFFVLFCIYDFYSRKYSSQQRMIRMGIAMVLLNAIIFNLLINY